MKKKIIKMFVAVLSLTLAFNLLTGCELSSNDQNDQVNAFASETYVSLSINPLVEFVVDKDNTVVAVNYANEDAEILLSDVDLVGKTLEEASEIFVELATEAGYIDVDSQDNEVTVTVLCEEEEEEAEVQTRLRERLNKFFENKGIFGKVTEATNEAFGDEIDALDIPIANKKMIMRLLQIDPELEIETLKDLSIKELVNMFKDYTKQGLDKTIRNEFSCAKQESRENFNQVVEDMYTAAQNVIEENYADMYSLEETITALQTELDSFTGTDEEKEVLQNNIAEKTEEYNTLKTNYDAEIAEALSDYQNMTGDYEALKQQHKEQIETLLEEAKAKREELREEQKERKQERMEQNKQKIEEFKQQIEEKMEERQQQIQEWRNQFQESFQQNIQENFQQNNQNGLGR